MTMNEFKSKFKKGGFFHFRWSAFLSSILTFLVLVIGAAMFVAGNYILSFFLPFILWLVFLLVQIVMIKLNWTSIAAWIDKRVSALF